MGLKELKRLSEVTNRSNLCSAELQLRLRVSEKHVEQLQTENTGESLWISCLWAALKAEICFESRWVWHVWINRAVIISLCVCVCVCVCVCFCLNCFLVPVLSFSLNQTDNRLQKSLFLPTNISHSSLALPAHLCLPGWSRSLLQTNMTSQTHMTDRDRDNRRDLFVFKSALFKTFSHLLPEPLWHVTGRCGVFLLFEVCVSARSLQPVNTV